MIKNQPGGEGNEESQAKNYFKDGFDYLISGIDLCIINMQKYSLRLPEERYRNLISLTNQLKSEINLCCSKDFRAKTLPKEATSDDDMLREGSPKYLKLQSELCLALKRNNKFLKANFKLKKKVRRLGLRLRKLSSTRVTHLSIKTEGEQEPSDIRKTHLRDTIPPIVDELKNELQRSRSEAEENAKGIERRIQSSFTSKTKQLTNMLGSKKIYASTKDQNHDQQKDRLEHSCRIVSQEFEKEFKKFSNKSTQVAVGKKLLDEVRFLNQTEVLATEIVAKYAQDCNILKKNFQANSELVKANGKAFKPPLRSITSFGDCKLFFQIFQL